MLQPGWPPAIPPQMLLNADGQVGLEGPTRLVVGDLFLLRTAEALSAQDLIGLVGATRLVERAELRTTGTIEVTAVTMRHIFTNFEFTQEGDQEMLRFAER